MSAEAEQRDESASPVEFDPDTPQGEVARRGLRLIRRHVRHEKPIFWLSVSGAAIFSISAVGTTKVLGKITDRVILPAFDEEQGVTSELVVAAAAALLLMAFLRALSIVSRRYFGAMTTRRSQARLRREITDQFMAVPLRYHRRTPTGQLLAHADSDIEASTEVLYPMPFSVGVSVLIFFSVVSLLSIDWVLTLVALALFPALAVLNKVYTGLVEVPAARVQAQVGRVAAVAHESIDGALVVKSLGREDDEVARMAVEADELRNRRIELGRLRAVFEPGIDAFPNIGIVALVLIGAWSIEWGRITPGELVEAASLFGILAFPMRVLGFFLQEVPRSVVSMARLDGVMAEPIEPRPTGDRSGASVGGPGTVAALAFDHVSFAWNPDEPVLTDVTFDVWPGEVVALVGSTGSGKSTIAELAARLYPADTGHITLAGVDMAQIPEPVLRSTVALVFQESYLFGDTLKANVGVGLDEDDAADRRDEVAAIAQVDRFLPDLPNGWDTVVGERGVTLSGGQRQRIALARALIREPQVLILDDATSAVDPTVEIEILHGLRNRLAVTTLVVAQRVSTIELSDRVVFLADGRVVATGVHQDLLATTPAYAAIVRAYEDSP